MFKARCTETSEEAENLGKMPWETLPVILARKVQQLEIGSVPLSTSGDLDAVGGLCAENGNGAMSCAGSTLLFPVVPQSAPGCFEVTERTHGCVTLRGLPLHCAFSLLPSDGSFNWLLLGFCLTSLPGYRK